MDEISPEFIERYQRLYQQDPNSRVFAPLVEAYRKMGLLQEAKELAEEGVQKHPHFAGGRIALGRSLLSLGDTTKAGDEFQTATLLAPDNWLAHQLLAETLLRLKRPKAALRAYKKLLFLNPKDTKSADIVKKLESLTADEYVDEAFALKPLAQIVKDWELETFAVETDDDQDIQNADDQSAQKEQFTLERFTSLADAFVVRNDMERALETLNEAEKQIGSDPEILKRMKLIHRRQGGQNQEPEAEGPVATQPPTREEMLREDKIEFLQRLLLQVEQVDRG